MTPIAYIWLNTIENDYCKVKCQKTLIFDSGQHTENITARIFDNRTRIWWKELLNHKIGGFSNIGHKLDYVGEMIITTEKNFKRDRTYEFYIKQNMHAVERAIFKKLSKNNILIKGFNINLRHPLNRKCRNFLSVNA